MTAVEVENLSVHYGSLRAVDDVSFVATFGEVTAVLGPNGAGKTSTIETCEGFRRPTSGSVRVLGLDPWTDRTTLHREVGVMLQDGGVYPSARVGKPSPSSAVSTTAAHQRPNSSHASVSPIARTPRGVDSPGVKSSASVSHLLLLLVHASPFSTSRRRAST